MTLSRALFHERAEEIDLYFGLLSDVIDRRANLVFPLPNDVSAETPREEKKVTLDLTHTLKANGFLLLYNLVEATMANAIEDIHHAIGADEAIGIDDLLDPLRKRAMTRFRTTSLDLDGRLEHPLSRSMLRYWLDDHTHCVNAERNPLFAGNVDAKKIREVAETYGFSSETDADKTRNGAKLLRVKNTRNDLAHGHVAFKDCGRELALSDLITIKVEVIHYLDCILSNIETYLNESQYRRQQPDAA